MAVDASGLRYAVRLRVCAKYFGQLCLVLSVLTCVPMAVALLHGEYRLTVRYLIIAAASLLGALLARLRAPRKMQGNEALVVVASVFLLAPLAMTFPLSATGMSFLDALFEAVSGATTTGLSTLSGVEDAPPAFLFSRAWMQWYGGLGIVVLSVALVSRAGGAAKELAATEADPDDLPGSTRAHARRVLRVYVLLTAGSTAVVWALGAAPGDALLYSMAAVSTGGFAPHNDSLAGLGGVVLQSVVIIVCILSAAPLTLFRRQGKNTRAGSLDGMQLRGLLVCGVLVSLLLGVTLHLGAAWSWSETLQNAPLLGFSAQTTAGFSTRSVAELDPGSKLVLILSMLTGGSVGSTAGGFKILRLLILVRLVHILVIRPGLSPRAILEPRLGRQRLGDDELHRALVLILLYPLFAALSWLPFLLWGYDPLDSLFEVSSAIGTVGLSTGVTDSGMPAFLKLVLCADMLLGRLEILAWLTFFCPTTWFGRRRKEP